MITINITLPVVFGLPGLYLILKMRKSIIFIDGNNFYHNLKKVINKPKEIDFNKLSKLICSKFNLDLVEIRYYNSVPKKSKEENYEKHLRFLEELKKDRIIVNTRELHGKGEYKREKGIDILIAVDMINKCLIKNECDVCILITGDADFLPVMQIIKDSKKEAIISSVYSGFSNRFREGKFRYLILKEQNILNCLRDKKN